MSKKNCYILILIFLLIFVVIIITIPDTVIVTILLAEPLESSIPAFDVFFVILGFLSLAITGGQTIQQIFDEFHYI